MKRKKLLAININEFNLDFLKKGAKKYNCKNILKFLKFKSIKTYSVDKEQDKDLDPWVQNISINTGRKSASHKIFNLGEKIPSNTFQIWDLLSKKKLYCAIWSPMNTIFKDNKYIELFIPDPWNYENKVKPPELKQMYKLPREYAQNYTNFKIHKNFNIILSFIYFIFNSGSYFYLLKNIPIYLSIFLKRGINNYFLFFLFDIISLSIFQRKTVNKKINFSLIFLNSLAHFQHNNWDDKSLHKDYFLLTDQIFQIIFDIGKNYNTWILYNGFSQVKIKSEFIIRPKNPKKFFSKIGIKFKKFHSNMTNGAILNFKNKNNFNDAIYKLKNYNIYGYRLFQIKILKNKQIFARVQVRSLNNIKKENIKNKFNFSKIFFYEKKNKKIKKKTNKDIYDFINSVVFIKTTSKHFPVGHLFYKNLKIKNKKIENTKIYNLIKNFFS